MEKRLAFTPKEKSEELAERRFRFDHPELARQWDKIQRRERDASMPKIVEPLEENLV